jgi:DNA-binding FadR family transcriptional regulator
MKEKNLLADLAAYLFAQSDAESGRTPSERELADHFTVSRGQIREALAILEAMRIVERRAKSGIYLTTRQASVEALALLPKPGAARSNPDLRDGRTSQDPRDQSRGIGLRTRTRTLSGCERYCAIGRATCEGEGLARQDRDFHLEIVRATQNSVFHKVCSVYYLLGEQRLPIYFNDRSAAVDRMPSICRFSTRSCAGTANLAQALMSAHLQGPRAIGRA